MLNLENLDARTRELMLDEIDSDVRSGSLYPSSRLSPQGLSDYPGLLREAAQRHDDAWLADQLRQGGRLNATEQRRRGTSSITAKVPTNAAEVIAEGEFNRFYARALCRRALEEGRTELIVYRAKPVANPRPKSQAMLDKPVDAAQLLEDLRANKEETVLGVPGGPGSGISVRLPS